MVLPGKTSVKVRQGLEYLRSSSGAERRNGGESRKYEKPGAGLPAGAMEQGKTFPFNIFFNYGKKICSLLLWQQFWWLDCTNIEI